MTLRTDIEFIIENIDTEQIGRVTHFFPTCTSTNECARELAEKGAEEGIIAIAGAQSAGKGRLDRSWVSPEGCLAMSILLRPDINRLQWLPAIAALAVQRAITSLNIPAVIKWPNDILIEGKKVGGILIESQIADDKPVYSIVGIGINIDIDFASFPEIENIATTLTAHNKEATGGKVAVNLLTEFEKLYLKTPDLESIRREWVAAMETIGKNIRANMGTVIEEGIAESINDHGNLVLRRKDGSAVEIVAGDVTLLKE